MPSRGDRAALALWRQITTYRAGIVALIAAVLLIVPVGVQGLTAAAWFTVLFALALAGSLAHWLLRGEHTRWVLIGEAAAVGLVSAVGQAAGAPWLALYIVVPAMWAGSTLPLARALVVGLLPAAILFGSAVAAEGPVGTSSVLWWVLSLSVTVVAVLLAGVKRS